MSKLKDLFKRFSNSEEESFREEDLSEISASRPSLEEVMNEAPKEEEKPAEDTETEKEEPKTDTVSDLLNPEQPVEEVKIDSLILEETDENNRIITPKRKHKEYYRGSLHEVTVSRITLIVWAIVIIIVAVLLSFIVADKVFFRSGYAQTTHKVIFDEEMADSSEVSKLQTVINKLESDFYPGVEKNQLIEGAIKGMVNELGDQFTVYYNPGTMENYTELINGTYKGLGIKFMSDSKGLCVTEIYNDSPASKTDLKVGEIVTKIDDTETVGITSAKLSELVNNKESVKLTVAAKDDEEKTREITVSVDTVAVQTVHEKSLGHGIYKVSISQFDEDTGEEFQKKVTDIIGKGGCKAIILDLRDNGGGYESQATMVADMILPKGTIATARDKNGKVFEEIESEASELEVPIAVLVNEKTASAAELVAGAVKDFEKGKLVGVKTYGKSIGQAQLTFGSDNSGLVFTVACFYTPSGNCIQGKGIIPDITVELAEELRGKPVSQIPEANDAQLQKAIAVIKEELSK